MTTNSKDKRTTTLVVIGLGVFVLAVIICAGVSSITNNRRDARSPTPDPYEVFVTVRNTCGVCGTDSPVGAWEAADGRSIILSDNGNYVATFKDGSTSTGTWSVDDGELCLTHAAGTACYAYRQKTDAMKLENAIYIRR
jgi:D-arabinose 1-dehydrogenase-like Zn-dependent alcohol dehydrogenase